MPLFIGSHRYDDGEMIYICTMKSIRYIIIDLSRNTLNFLLYCLNIFLYPETQHIVVENENETQYIVFQKRQAQYLFL